MRHVPSLLLTFLRSSLAALLLAGITRAFLPIATMSLEGSLASFSSLLAALLGGLALGAWVGAAWSPSRFSTLGLALLWAATLPTSLYVLPLASSAHWLFGVGLVLTVFVPAGVLLHRAECLSRPFSSALAAVIAWSLVPPLLPTQPPAWLIPGLGLTLLLPAALAPDRPRQPLQVSPSVSPGGALRVSSLRGLWLGGFVAAAVALLPLLSPSFLEDRWTLLSSVLLLSCAGLTLGQRRASEAAARWASAGLLLPAFSLGALLWGLPQLSQQASSFGGLTSQLLLWGGLTLFLLLILLPLTALPVSPSPRSMSLELLAVAIGLIGTTRLLRPVLSTQGTLALLTSLLLLGALLTWVGGIVRMAKAAPRRFLGAGLLLLLSPVPFLCGTWNPRELGLHPMDPASTTPAFPAYLAEDEHGQAFLVGEGQEAVAYLEQRRWSGPADQRGDVFLGHLASSLGPTTQSQTLVVGSGSDATLEALLSSPQPRLLWLEPSRLRARLLDVRRPGAAGFLGDPRIVLQRQALRPFATGHPGGFSRVIVLRPAPGSDQARGLYSLEGLQVLRGLLTRDGLLVMDLALDMDPSWVRRALVTYHQVFPQGLVWLCPGSAQRLILTATPGNLSLQPDRLEAPFRRSNSREQLVQAGFTSGRSLLEQLFLLPDGLKGLTDAPFLDRGPWPAEKTQGPSPLAVLKPCLRPLLPALDRASVTTDPSLLGFLDKLVHRHQTWLELLDELDAGQLDRAFDQARKLSSQTAAGAGPLSELSAPYLERARRLSRSGQLERAVEQLAVARVLQPDQGDIPAALGDVYLQKGQRVKAMELYREALRLEPGAPGPALALAGLLREDGRLKEAVALLEDVAAGAPANAILSHNLGTFYLAMEQKEKARQAFALAARLDGRLAEPHLGLAELYFREGRLEAAQEEAQLAVTLKATAEGLNLLGQVALRRGDGAKARSALVQCLLQNPDHLEARGAMGILYAEAGDYQKARDAWETVLRLDPENRAARLNLERLQQEYGPRKP